MSIQKRTKQDLPAAIKSKNEKRKDALRVIIGEFERSVKKELSDDEAIKILKKLVKSEKELLEKKGAETDSEFVRVVENYLPKMATDEEIMEWIKQNIDFSEFKNKMQAMGSIMKHFGATADGNAVKKILQKM